MKLERLSDQEKKLANEHSFGVADALRSKPKVTIARLGQIDGPQSAESAAINFMQVTEALIDVKAMEAIGKPPVTLSLIKKYAGLYRTGKRKAWLQENKLLMPTYGHTMFADMDAMFASIEGPLKSSGTLTRSRQARMPLT